MLSDPDAHGNGVTPCLKTGEDARRDDTSSKFKMKAFPFRSLRHGRGCETINIKNKKNEKNPDGFCHLVDGGLEIEPHDVCEAGKKRDLRTDEWRMIGLRCEKGKKKRRNRKQRGAGRSFLMPPSPSERQEVRKREGSGAFPPFAPAWKEKKKKDK